MITVSVAANCFPTIKKWSDVLILELRFGGMLVDSGLGQGCVQLPLHSAVVV